MSTNTLSAPELKAYHEDGYVVRPGVFSHTAMTALADAVEESVLRARAEVPHGHTYYLDGKRFVDTTSCTVQFEHTADSDEIRVIEPIHHLHAAINALVDDPKITEPMCAIVGQPRLALWTAKLNLKRAEAGSGFGWHQDSPYWMHNCNHVDLLPNVMIAIDEQTPDNGCFEVIRGSHRHGILPGTVDGSRLGGFFTDPKTFDLTQRQPLTGPAGSLFFFSPHSVHGSQPNHSNRARRALIFTYQPADKPMLKINAVRNVAS